MFKLFRNNEQVGRADGYSHIDDAISWAKTLSNGLVVDIHYVDANRGINRLVRCIHVSA